MILTGPEIEQEVRAGRIVIEPFDPRYLEPNSYGYHLGRKLKRYTTPILDASQALPFETILLRDEGFELQTNQIYLAETHEIMGSDYYVATLYSRRSTATLGLYIQVSAPLGHQGAKISWTLELRALHPVIIYPGMLIGKIAFWMPVGDYQYYRGKYQGSREPEVSRLYEDINIVNAGEKERPCLKFP
jgi:dCTP deaminase